MKQILSLGFNKEDAPRLYDQKEDWMGLNSGGSVFCAHKGCKFRTKIESDDLFEHCRSVHLWRDYPCQEENCNFVAYCSTGGWDINCRDTNLTCLYVCMFFFIMTSAYYKPLNSYQKTRPISLIVSLQAPCLQVFDSRLLSWIQRPNAKTKS